MWTFGKRIAAGFSLSFLMVMTIGAIGYRSVKVMEKTSYQVAHTHLVLEHISSLIDLLRDAETAQRGYIITGNEIFLGPYLGVDAATAKVLRQLRELTADNPEQQQHLHDLGPPLAAKLEWMRQTIDVRRTEGPEQAARMIQTTGGKTIMDALRHILGAMEGEEYALLKRRADDVAATARGTASTIAVTTLFCLLLLSSAGFFTARALTRRVGSAVQHVQSSAAELQAAANQQVSSAREQATAMNEIDTTISELLTTSRQIADSAQRVARISTETVSAARTGDETVLRTQRSVATIRRQVDVIVGHMIALGSKSQQVGGILEIINELAEQTNILSINATIEAVGAGETGRRFGAVADEIRKLADRVGGSTRDIRALVDDIRAAVNTTVMATEGGSKAVDAGALLFGEVATSFMRIAGMVAATTEAAREIELSTKQQATAIEQVNLAIANVSQATKESEASSNQTLQTSSLLAGLSKDLAQLIQPRASART